jgi:hypothetical protein
MVQLTRHEPVPEYRIVNEGLAADRTGGGPGHAAAYQTRGETVLLVR